jgi:hypothetical protein
MTRVAGPNAVVSALFFDPVVGGAIATSSPTPTTSSTPTLTPTPTRGATATSTPVPTITSTPSPTPTLVLGANAASFVSQDTTTQGSWKGVYGSQGYWLEADGQVLPTYAQVSVTAQTYTWAASTSDVRALQKAGSATDRVAATWYDGVKFSVDVNLTDGQSHRVSIYSVDWDSMGRAQTVEVLDATSGAVLDSRSLSSFPGGTYLSWTVHGHVQLRMTRVAGPNAVVSALFF